VIENQRSPLWRLARSLGMDGDSTFAEVRAELARKSWNGQKWVNDETADISLSAAEHS
jgi:hypothetical protein